MKRPAPSSQLREVDDELPVMLLESPRYVVGPSGTVLVVFCIDNSHYTASLELHKVYRTVSDEDTERDGHLRIIYAGLHLGR